MIDAIMNLNPVFGISVSVVLLVIMGFIPYLVGRLLLAKHIDMKGENVVTLLYRSVWILLGLMLSLSFNQTRSEYIQIQNSVELEAEEITKLGRDLVRFGSNESKQLAAKLVEYTKTVMNEEWSELAAGRKSQKALLLHEEIENGILAIKPDSPFKNDLKNRLLNDVDKITDYRAKRVFNSNVTMKWFLLVALIGFLISTFLLFVHPARIPTLVSVACYSAFTAIVIYSVVALNRPYQGLTTVSVKPLQTVHDYLISQPDIEKLISESENVPAK